jgi:hypothetical protein
MSQADNLAALATNVNSSGVLQPAGGGTGTTTSTGTGSAVLSNSPTLVTPTLGSATATQLATGLGTVSAPALTFTGDTNTGIYSPAADTIAFTEGGVESMRIDSSGNVGIGTSSPLGKLQSSSGSFGGSVSSNANQIIAESSGNSGVTIASGASSLGNIFFADSGDTADGYVQYDQSGRSMRFGTATAERMRITSTGGLAVGTTSDPGVGAIYATGNITAFFSDERLKTKTGDIENALDKVCQIETLLYHANETAVELGYDASIQEVGVTAQSVQKVQPEVVVPAPVDDKYLTVRYEKLVPLLIEAIKELKAEIDSLKNK